MKKKPEKDVMELLLEAHRKGVEYAIDLSARTGVPMVFCENGKIIKVHAPYKYIRVPRDSNESHPGL